MASRRVESRAELDAIRQSRAERRALGQPSNWDMVFIAPRWLEAERAPRATALRRGAQSSGDSAGYRGR